MVLKMDTISYSFIEVIISRSTLFKSQWGVVGNVAQTV